ncbi:hypothetical protein Sango_3045800 [Sesamum angolense]|uniref:Uncharacterized protein n=1 Tax=Sesamum angolense TaxID=2727404 RepID=A0AAE1TAK2_9LAMI|nr:hypothetical protein Sango_3045800 [Sesamum angolense]
MLELEDIREGIKDCIWRKLHSWSSKKLSQEGGAVLLKLVPQTIPTYAMSCFRLPDSFLVSLKVLRQKFFGIMVLVRRSIDRQGLNCASKQIWGVSGFVTLGSPIFPFLLNKLSCPTSRERLTVSPQLQIFPSFDFLQGTAEIIPSYMWQLVWGTRDLLAAGIRWKVGTACLFQSWVPLGS